MNNDDNDNNINNINNINNNEFVFEFTNNETINNENIIQLIDLMMNNLKNNTDIFNIQNENNDTIQLNIEFEIHNYNEGLDDDDELEDYFKNCKEINEKVSKSEKIKANDPVLNEDCLICMEKYKSGELKRKIPKCSHYFHKKCIDKWLKKKATCPICRCNLLENEEDADAADAANTADAEYAENTADAEDSEKENTKK
jgi:hypothetical protein